jgi:hypothetical protein
MDQPPVARPMDEFVEEVLVRVLPEDPASLVGAALVCILQALVPRYL